jgi:hypothetical protein
MFIAPYDAMWREIGCLYRALEFERAALETATAGVTPAQLHARPIAAGPSIASLLLAFGADEATWLHRRWRAAPTPPAWQTFQDASGSPALEPLLQWLRDVREATRAKLIKATDPDLDRQTIVTERGAASLRFVLHHLLAQAAWSRGQIALVRAVLP